MRFVSITFHQPRGMVQHALVAMLPAFHTRVLIGPAASSTALTISHLITVRHVGGRRNASQLVGQPARRELTVKIVHRQARAHGRNAEPARTVNIRAAASKR